MKTFQQFQEGKGDAIKAAIMLGKKIKQVSPKLMAKTKEFLRNQRSGLGTTARRSQNQLKSIDMKDAKKILQNPKKFGEDDIKFAKEISFQGKKNVMPGEKINKADKYSNLAANRKSIHPPTADAAQAELTDRKVQLITNKNNRRREKEKILRRMFNMGEK